MIELGAFLSSVGLFGIRNCKISIANIAKFVGGNGCHIKPCCRCIFRYILLSLIQLEVRLSSAQHMHFVVNIHT